ncbi:GAF domain-containing protein [Kovacikia minuta CCNUW1]|uniref:GAF domain-containing protein n=1 Tax=Kovacikia minuta TaxID=2931930 RepID=UPI001CCE7B23|nr:GAF domain-containing protein [Kovacikia minuta]UBF27902.1 GAF domain-containing protein [Kovacikia minuta CCNUW1]
MVNDTEQIEKTPLMRECSQRSLFRAGMGIGLRLNGEMFGVLIAQQCCGPRQWEPFEIELMEQLATQVEIAIQQGQLYRQVQTFAANLECQVEERTAELHAADARTSKPESGERPASPCRLPRPADSYPGDANGV